MPYQPIWLENAFILPMALLPLAIQSLAYYLKPGSAWSPWSAYLMYRASPISRCASLTSTDLAFIRAQLTPSDHS